MPAASGSDLTRLGDLGWDDFFSRQLAPTDSTDFLPARVSGEERGFYRVQFEPDHWFWAEVSGRLRHQAVARRDFAAVGDWVLCTGDLSNPDARLVIQRVLERRSLLVRKAAGEGEGEAPPAPGWAGVEAREQVLAANVDTAFLMTSLNHDFNPRRLDRYLTLILDGGARPVVLLTKSDLVVDASAAVDKVRAAAPGVAVHAISVPGEQGLEALADYLRAGQTIVLLGSSGVGKSTLVNRLLGREANKTQEIRAHDQRGRHTTTTRSLFRLESGAMLIDTPGMRELQMLDHEGGLNTLYADVHERILRCKFTNCRHAAEPGCAVRAALDSGELARERWEAYLKIESQIAAREHKAKKDEPVAGRNRYKKAEKKTAGPYQAEALGENLANSGCR